MSPARAAAFAALRRLRRGNAHLDDSAAALPELSVLSIADRGLANELINGTVKRRGSIDAVLGVYTKAPLKSTDPDVRDALRLATFQLLFLDRVPAYAVVDDAVTLATRKSKRAGGFVNAVLRRVAVDGRAKLAELGEGDEARAWAAGLSYPLWLVKRVRADLGVEAARRLLEAGNAAPERCLRANRLRGGLPAARRAMAAEGFKTSGVDGLPDALLYEGPPLERSGVFRDGLVTPQSRGSQIAATVAAGGVAGPGAQVLDLCAAPGAKTSQLAALLPEAKITAVEVDEARAGELRANLARLGADGVNVVRADALELPAGWDGTFDDVLLDAPCSGLGTLASRADLRWRRQRRRRAAPRRPPGAAAGARRRRRQARRRADLRGLHHDPRRDPRRRRAAARRRRLDGRRPRRGLAGSGAPASGGFLLVLPPDGGSTGFFVARLRRVGRSGRPAPRGAAAR